MTYNDATIELIDIDTITAIHGVQDQAKLAELVESMRKDGWQGRPLLVLDEPATWQAVTGAHRYAAAVEAGLDHIPCVVVTAAHLGGTDPYTTFGNVSADTVAAALWDNGMEELHGICY